MCLCPFSNVCCCCCCRWHCKKEVKKQTENRRPKKDVTKIHNKVHFMPLQASRSSCLVSSFICVCVCERMCVVFFIVSVYVFGQQKEFHLTFGYNSFFSPSCSFFHILLLLLLLLCIIVDAAEVGLRHK